MATHIGITLSSIFEISLFQIAALYVYSKLYNRCMTILNQNSCVKESKLFDDAPFDNYYTINDTRDENTVPIVPYGFNIMLSGTFENYKSLNEDALEFMRNVVYINEDNMYQAYDRYNDIKMSVSDNDMVSLYYDNDEANICYYKKAVILANKTNVIIFSPDPSKLLKIFETYDYNVKVVWDENAWVRMILLSFFQHNIISYNAPHFSMWAAYLSKYENCKTVVLPDHTHLIANNKINNMNIVYLSGS